MVPSRFAERLRSGDRLLGALVQDPDPAVAMRLVARGYDWLFLDGEHGGYGGAQASAVVDALGGAMPCLLRVPLLAHAVLDAAAVCGVEGLIVPHVDTPDQARSAVEAVRGRGLVVIQAESVEAVRNIESLARVPGVDAVFVGPHDLSASLGIPDQFEHPALLGALESVAVACRAVGMPLGIYRHAIAQIHPYEAQGFTLLAVAAD